MEHKGTTVITSKRLLLRRFAIEDAEAIDVYKRQV